MDRTALSVFAAALVAGAALGVAACATVPPPPPQPAFQCVAGPGAWAIGKAATDDVVERVRVDTRSRIARVLHPNQAITMEFSAERVNVNVNERNAIVGITCG